ncbi:MAG TPA: hypothetical protein DD423_04630 [Opitutae bacterium]|jgi:hypothetical protein|nr:hypothetical protein [Opitutae bacterium]
MVGMLDSLRCQAVLMKALIKKFTVAGLLSLFAWNVALAGVPGLMLCLHQDSIVHLQSEDACGGHGEDAHTHEVAEDVGFCELAHDCTDFQLVGTVVISTRLNESEAIALPVAPLIAFNDPAPQPKVFQVRAPLRPPLRAPPSVYWLTADLLQTTVLRI